MPLLALISQRSLTLAAKQEFLNREAREGR
jgi:hypothetical protein